MEYMLILEKSKTLVLRFYGHWKTPVRDGHKHTRNGASLLLPSSSIEQVLDILSSYVKKHLNEMSYIYVFTMKTGGI